MMPMLEMKIFFSHSTNRKRRHSLFNKATAAFLVCDFQIEQWKHISPEIRRLFHW